MNYSLRSRPLCHGSATCGAGSRLKGSVWDELTCVPPQRASAFFRGDYTMDLGLEWPAGITHECMGHGNICAILLQTDQRKLSA